MRTNAAVHSCCMALLAIAGISAVALLIEGRDDEKSPTLVNAATAMTQSNTEGHAPLDYRVWRVFPEDRKGFTVVVVSVNPRHFNRADMSALAMRLNKEFTEKTKLKVGLLDDDNVARLFATGRAELSTYYTAERGHYYLDRTKCKEYIQFSTQRGKQRETLRLNCSRPKQ